MSSCGGAGPGGISTVEFTVLIRRLVDLSTIPSSFDAFFPFIIQLLGVSLSLSVGRSGSLSVMPSFVDSPAYPACCSVDDPRQLLRKDQCNPSGKSPHSHFSTATYSSALAMGSSLVDHLVVGPNSHTDVSSHCLMVPTHPVCTTRLCPAPHVGPPSWCAYVVCSIYQYDKDWALS